VPGVQQVGAIPVLAPRGASRDPLHAMDLADKNGDVQQGIASVRKLMILMVLLDQVKAGVVDLDDMVSISEAATKPGGLGLVEDEQMSLRDLAYAMIMRSAKDATWAISEYIGGTVDNFVTMMNAKAAELGMSNTIYCHDSDDRTFSSVGYSTARDQAKLWDAVYDDPDFLDITGKLSTTVCGTLPDASQKCDLLKTRTDMFLGTDGWKGGSGAITCKGYEAVPKCNVCLSAQATRLDRPVSAVSLSSDDQPSTAFGDVWATFGWSYRQIYTPDYRGNSGAQAGVATDFGVDAVTDTFAVTVVPDSGTQLKLCHWQVVAGIGTVNKLMCATRGIAGLVASGTVATPRRVGLASLSTLEAEADYLLGRLTAGALSLSVWRVGQKDF
jgi:D-alanyl-D-alanine carboxypeptidase